MIKNSVWMMLAIFVAVTPAWMARGEQATPSSPAPVVPEGPETSGSVAKAFAQQLRVTVEQLIQKQLSEGGGGNAAIREVKAFPVDATSAEWQNSGVHVTAGQHVLTQAAEGEKWNAGQGLTTAKGYSGTLNHWMGEEASDVEQQQQPRWHRGALICAIGHNNLEEVEDQANQLEIGAGREFTARKDGYIYFMCNTGSRPQSRIDGFPENSGIIHVRVKVTDTAPSAAPDAAVSTSTTDSTKADVVQTTAQAFTSSSGTALVQEVTRDLAAAGINSEAEGFPVDSACDTWQNTGVLVKPGQHVLVEASRTELWNLAWGLVDAKGYAHQKDAGSAFEPVFHSGTEDVDFHWGSLICAVGKDRKEIENPDSQAEIGMAKRFTVDNGGYVYLMCNDCQQHPIGFKDNSGIIHVTVTVLDAAGPGMASATASPTAANTPAGR